MNEEEASIMTSPHFTKTAMGKQEALLLALVLVAAFHAIPYWVVLSFLPAQAIYDRLGANGYYTLCDAITIVIPLLLCLGMPSRSGFRIGVWRGHVWQVLAVCTLPIILTACIYPFTSRPFSEGRIGLWLLSPLAQDLLFTGYLYGLFDAVFPGTIHPRVPARRAIFWTALFFALWHVPNFAGLSAAYVTFQLAYVLIGGAWILLARQMTGSIIPGVVVHMAINFIAWL